MGKRIIKKVFSVLAVVAFLGLSGVCLAAEYLPPPISPMPEKFKNIQIVKPAPGVPKEITDFLGEWEGVWKNKFGLPSPSRRGKLIVYEVFDNKLKFLWAIGDNPNFATPGGWTKKEAEIEDFEGKKTFSHFFSKTGRFAYFYLENGKLIGKMRDLEIEMNQVK